MIELFGQEFFQRALAASLLGGITCGIVGVWVILLNIPFIGVAMSHSAFAGAVFGLLFNINPLLTAIIFCLIAALAIGPIADRGDFSPNISVSVVFSVFLGIAFIGIGLIKGPKTEALNFLWGNILTISWSSVIFLLLILLSITVFLVAFYKETLSVLFNREIAKAVGIHEQLILYCLLFICGITVTLNLNTIGGLLIFSLVTGPPLAAYQLTYNLKIMYVLSAIFGVIACFTGLFISYFLNVPSGATIIVVSSVILGICILLSPKRITV